MPSTSFRKNTEDLAAPSVVCLLQHSAVSPFAADRCAHAPFKGAKRRQNSLSQFEFIFQRLNQEIVLCSIRDLCNRKDHDRSALPNRTMAAQRRLPCRHGTAVLAPCSLHMHSWSIPGRRTSTGRCAQLLGAFRELSGFNGCLPADRGSPTLWIVGNAP